MKPLRAIIADDEEALLRHLKAKLEALWPDLQICGEAQNGAEALALIQAEKPQIAFLDIRMPGMSGIEVARRILDTPCRVVFVTAYDQYAIDAFENAAIDYLLKPLSDERLKKTISRLKKMLAQSEAPQPDVKATLEQVLTALQKRPTQEYLQWIKVQTGETLRLIAAAEVCYFKAADKYTVVMTREGESLIKKSIASLTEELDPTRFWRIHRGTIVNVGQIQSVSRSITGRAVIRLKDRPETLTVSRSYAHLFRQM